MASPYRILTFDIVGTLIDFEQGVLDCLHQQLDAATRQQHDDAALLLAFGRAEAIQQELTPAIPFSEMLAPVYHRMAAELGITP